MKRLALLFAAAMMLLPAQAQSGDHGYWANRVIGSNYDGTARYARVGSLTLANLGNDVRVDQELHRSILRHPF